jgi:hypothetical protein
VTARQIDSAAARLRELRAVAWEDLGLAALAFGLALAASQLRPGVALPLLAGALAMTFLGMRAYVRRSFLVEDLAEEPEAYELLPDVRRFGARAASLERRRLLARSLRATLEGSTAGIATRVAAVRPELVEIIAVLEDERTKLEPFTAVSVERRLQEFRVLLGDPSRSPAELRAGLRSLLAGLDR